MEGAAAQNGIQKRIVGQSPVIQDIKAELLKIAQTDATILLTGETGVGKSLFAQFIHDRSDRSTERFARINLAAIPGELFESELFGTEKGAYTGAHERRNGKFEFADRGTIFLDEIGAVSLPNQAKLLHVIEREPFYRLGGNTQIKTNARIIAATNSDLKAAVERGKFREDLFYRLATFAVNIPPLRLRYEDIPDIVAHILEIEGKAGVAVDPDVFKMFRVHPWRGNIRELENVIKSALLRMNGSGRIGIRDIRLDAQAQMPDSRTTEIGISNVPFIPDIAAGSGDDVSLLEIAERARIASEREAMLRVLEYTRWNRKKAAKILKISYRALILRLHNPKYNIPGDAS